jgi:signal transduction histidine kinase
MGMGLAISRSIVEGHGGRIRAVNHPGGGAVVHVTLPVSSNAA